MPGDESFLASSLFRASVGLKEVVIVNVLSHIYFKSVFSHAE